MLLNALSVIIGLLGTIALSKAMSFMTEETAYTNSLASFLFVLFAVIILRYVYKHVRWRDRKGLISSGIFSFGLSFAMTAGKQLQTVENFAAGNPFLWLQIIVLTLFFHGPVLYVFQWLADYLNDVVGLKNKKEAPKSEHLQEPAQIEKNRGKKEWKSFLLTWGIIFLCWIPVFLAFYPGAFVYDAQDEYVQVATRTFTTHHPLTHVLLLGGFVCLGNKLFSSYNIGIALYTIFQMFILSGIFAYTISYLKKHLSKRWCIGITLFYGLFPVIPMYAVCSAKDTLFTGAFLLMLVQMIKMSESVFLKKDAVVFIISSVAMMLLRNNGVMAYAALLVVVLIVIFSMFILAKQKERKIFLRFAAMMAAALLLYGGVNKTLALVLHADDSENQEILTVPIQQLARTYKYSPEVFSDEEKETLFSYIPENALQVYDADLSDLVKVNFNNAKFKEKPADFLGLWLKTFTKKPVTYLNAWLMTSYGYWYPDTIINVYGGQQRFTFQYGESSYFGFETEPPGERDSKYPWLEEQYRRMSLTLCQQKVPGISMLFSPGFLFWIYFGCLLFCFYGKQYHLLLPFGSIILLWVTAVFGPTFLVRYVLIFWFALPLVKIVNTP